MAQIQHHNECSQEIRRDSGYEHDGEHFIEKYKLNVDFDLTCLGCCFCYLRQRSYQEVLCAQFDRVCYSIDSLAVPGTPIPGNIVSSYVKVPGGSGKKGQISTGKDLNLGIPSARPFADSRTYQMYSETGNLSVGFNTHARMECVAIDVVRPDELLNIYLNYANAVLVELYRQKKDQDSLSQTEVTGYLLKR